MAASVITMALFLTLGGSPIASASSSGSSSHDGASLSSATPAAGYDLSWPQCGAGYPPSPAFGIVGLNGGLPNDLNGCFGPSSSYPSYEKSELYWATAHSTGATAEPKASLYINTSDPGDVDDDAPIADWPTSGTTPDGRCTTTTYTYQHKSYVVGQDSEACAWEYGAARVAQDLSWLSSAAAAIDQQQTTVAVPGSASAYPWWLDVETGNTWQTGSSGIAMNMADLQGVVATLKSAGVSFVGVYSTAQQWTQIAGTTTPSSGDLYSLPDWVPGASTSAGAASNCGLASFTAGTIELTQWTASLDEDHVC